MKLKSIDQFFLYHYLSESTSPVDPLSINLHVTEVFRWILDSSGCPEHSKHFAKLDSFLADGSQRRGSICADREIIKPDDADLVRNFVSELLALDHRGIGDQIIAADNAGDPHV